MQLLQLMHCGFGSVLLLTFLCFESCRAQSFYNSVDQLLNMSNKATYIDIPEKFTRVKVDFSEWQFSAVKEHGNTRPIIQVQVLVTLQWKDANKFQGWTWKDLGFVQILHFSHNINPFPFAKVFLGGYPHTSRFTNIDDAGVPQDLVLNRDGTIQSSFYVNFELLMLSRDADRYPNNYFTSSFAVFGKAESSNYNFIRGYDTFCAKQDIDRKCSSVIETGYTIDKKWQWSVSVKDVKWFKRNLLLTFTLRRARQTIQSELKEQAALIMPGFWDRWINEGKITFFLHMYVIGQYLVPVLLRERLLLGLVNLGLLCFSLNHFDSLPALQFVDTCDWLTYTIIVFALQIYALIWFSSKAFVCYNSTLLGKAGTLWIDHVICRWVLALGMVNADKAKAIYQNICVIESSSRFTNQPPCGGVPLVGRPSVAVEENELKEGQVSVNLQDTTTTTASQIAAQLEDITRSNGEVHPALLQFYILMLALDRIHFVINAVIGMGLYCAYA